MHPAQHQMSTLGRLQDAQEDHPLQEQLAVLLHILNGMFIGVAGKVWAPDTSLTNRTKLRKMRVQPCQHWLMSWLAHCITFRV